jgi:hypothetical protein
LRFISIAWWAPWERDERRAMVPIRERMHAQDAGIEGTYRSGAIECFHVRCCELLDTSVECSADLREIVTHRSDATDSARRHHASAPPTHPC